MRLGPEVVFAKREVPGWQADARRDLPWLVASTLGVPRVRGVRPEEDS
jgi:hypothetical protein